MKQIGVPEVADGQRDQGEPQMSVPQKTGKSLATAIPPRAGDEAVRPRRWLTFGGLAVSCLAIAGALSLAPSVSAATTPAPGLTVVSVANPTNFAPSTNSECREAVEGGGTGLVGQGSFHCDNYEITVRNEGAEATNGEPVTIEDHLPADLTAVSVASVEGAPELSCSVATVSCTFEGVRPAGGSLVMLVDVEVSPTAPPSVENQVTVSGGGAATITSSSLTTVSETLPAFGVADFGFTPFSSDGAPDLQAGDHPNAVTVHIGLATLKQHEGSGRVKYRPVESPKDVLVDLPPGLVGNPQALPRCPEHLILESACPAATQVGTIRISAEEPNLDGIVPIFNLEPERGYPAEFGFEYLSREFTMYANLVRTPGGYGLRVSVPGIPRLKGFLLISGITVSFFGDPATHAGGLTPSFAFFNNPTNCAAAPLQAGVEVDSWQTPGAFASAETGSYPRLSGCDRLQFQPSLSAQPGTAQADQPSGLDVDLQVPQAPNVAPILATPPVKDVTVALPQGLVVNPSSASGLVGCKAEGPEGINIGSANVASDGQDLGDPEATELGDGQGHPGESFYGDGLYHTAAGHCPAASSLGTVDVTTPLLEQPLVGNVYIGTPDCAPCSTQDAAEGKLLKLYIEVAGSGVIVKLPGTVSVGPGGQLTASFKENPQLPFSDLKVHFKEGQRAPLTTPSTCGHYTTNTDLVPWSTPETPDATSQSDFDISSGPGGVPCAGTEAGLPNKPSFEAGTTTPIAGVYSPFVLKVSREPGSQRISSIDTTLPPGLTGKLAGIPYCSNAAIEAARGTGGRTELASPSCPLASEVGTVNVGAGSGTPFYVQGHAYLAGSYKGAPLSLAIITPAVAGPFDLGTVVVRTALYVNETTAQIHAVSDPIPSILAGIPLDIRSVALNMNKPNFTLNPTSCEPMSVLGSATSVLNQPVSLTSPFQVGECSKLGFKPGLSIHLKGATKRAGNPALRAVVTYPKKGSYANIARAQVTLPKSEFLDNAHIRTVCTRVQFAAHACPPASVYGKAIAYTPLLDQPLSGPVYLRSSSNKLPDLVADLNGQIEVALDGKVDTGKGGGIRNTFTAVPDAPVSKFVLSLDGGKKGLLVNSENLCSPRAKTKAVANFTAQNGKTYDTTPAVTNSCKKNKKHRGKR